MKIACPQCGQHYEVDAGALERFFRCTECQNVFRGLNAKAVKVRKFRRRKKDSQAEAQAEITAVAVQEEKVPVLNETASVDPAADNASDDIAAENEMLTAEVVEENAESDFVGEDDAESRISIDFSNLKKQFAYIRSHYPWLPVLVGVVLVLSFVLVLMAHSKVNELNVRAKAMETMLVDLQNRNKELAEKNDLLNNQVIVLQNTVKMLETFCENANARLNDNSLVSKVAKLEKDAESITVMRDQLLVVSKKLNDWEDSSAAAAKRRNRR